MEFWNDEITETSWKKLISLRNTLDFVLIGGWAVYLYTKLHKSKDIDIVIDYSVLNKLQKEYTLNKNERLKKYEIKLEDGFDIDIYLSGYSILSFPVKDILENTMIREGFKVPRPEILLLLKLGAFMNRKNSIKGGKDAIDILGIMFYADIDFEFLKKIIEKHKLEGCQKELLNVLNEFELSMIKYLNLNQNSFSKLRNKYKKKVIEIL